MTPAPTRRRNLWPLIPVVILGGTVVANILLIKLAVSTDDERLPMEPTEQVTTPTEAE